MGRCSVPSARLGTETPVFGFNFGRMGFLTSARGSELETVIPRVFAGEFRVVQLATLEARLQGDEVEKGVNDVVVTSARVGRMAELRWRSRRAPRRPAGDGMICATPAGSTAYNLSNGGPVMMWGIDAMGITFVAPHSLEARPVVVPRGYELKIENLTRGGDVAVIVDGRGCTRLEPGDSIVVGLGEERSGSRTSPRSASSRATTTSSGSAPLIAHRELRPDPRGEPRARPGGERRHR